MMDPLGLIASAEVPFTAPGASNVMMAVFRSFAFAERTNPDVARLTANTGKSAVRVAIA